MNFNTINKIAGHKINKTFKNNKNIGSEILKQGKCSAADIVPVLKPKPDNNTNKYITRFCELEKTLQKDWQNYLKYSQYKQK